MKSTRRPGDLILDQYLPDATPDVREKAREKLMVLAGIIYRICESEAAAARSATRENSTEILQ